MILVLSKELLILCDGTQSPCLLSVREEKVIIYYGSLAQNSAWLITEWTKHVQKEQAATAPQWQENTRPLPASSSEPLTILGLQFVVN